MTDESERRELATVIFHAIAKNASGGKIDCDAAAAAILAAGWVRPPC